MKLPNSLTGPSNRGHDLPEERPWKSHGCLPGIVVLVWLLWVCRPLFTDFRTIVFLPFLPFSFVPWLERLPLPPEMHVGLSVSLFILLLSLPWFSLLASRIPVTVVCTGLCLFLATGQTTGCQRMGKGFSKLASSELNVPIPLIPSPFSLSSNPMWFKLIHLQD